MLFGILCMGLLSIATTYTMADSGPPRYEMDDSEKTRLKDIFQPSWTCRGQLSELESEFTRMMDVVNNCATTLHYVRWKMKGQMLSSEAKVRWLERQLWNSHFLLGTRSHQVMATDTSDRPRRIKGWSSREKVKLDKALESIAELRSWLLVWRTSPGRRRQRILLSCGGQNYRKTDNPRDVWPISRAAADRTCK